MPPGFECHAVASYEKALAQVRQLVDVLERLDLKQLRIFGTQVPDNDEGFVEQHTADLVVVCPEGLVSVFLELP